MPAVRRNPALVIFGNPPQVRSESAAWKQVAAFAQDIAEVSDNELTVLQLVTELRVLAQRMLAQVERGVHANPRERRTKIGEHVQAVLYVHAKDHLPYAHGFGNADIAIDTVREGDVKLEGLHDTTDVCMYGEPDGTITMEGKRGQPLWKMHEVDEH